jgi:hypothetical protein
VFGVFFPGQAYFGQSINSGTVPSDLVIGVDPSRVWYVDERLTAWIIEDRADTWTTTRSSTWTVD